MLVEEGVIVENEEIVKSSTILLVDDEPNVLNALKRILKRVKYNVVTAPGGQEGLAVLEKQKIDLIISDMRMPEMDGASFLAIAAEKYPDAQRFVLTGYADMETTIKAINRGHIHGYMTKPWADEELKKRVYQALKQRYFEGENQRLQAIVAERNEELKTLNVDLEKKVEQRTVVLKKAFEMLERSNEEYKSSFFSVIPVISKIIETKLVQKNNYLDDIGELAIELAKKAELNEDEGKSIYYAALLSDAGKLGVPPAILKKPLEALETSEKDIYTKHPLFAEKIFSDIDYLKPVSIILREQCEYCDGSGYPSKLKADDITKEAKILCIIRDFFALQEGHLVLENCDFEQALVYLRENAGTKYDLNLTKMFFQIVQNWRKQKFIEVTVNPDGLMEGMILCKDLFTDTNMLLLAKGKKLDQEMIDSIRAHASEWKSLSAITVYQMK